MRSILRLRLCVLLAGLLAASAAHAQTVTISFGAGTFYGNGGTKVPAGSLVLLIADTNQNGFGSLFNGSSLTTGSFLNADDQILGQAFTAVDGSAVATFSLIPLQSAPYTNLTAGDPLAVVWFSVLDGSSTNLTTGDSYGIFSNGISPADGNSWVVPAASQTTSLNFRTVDAGGAHSESEGRTTLTVSAIPEPATYAAIVGAMMLGLAFFRRRKVNA